MRPLVIQGIQTNQSCPGNKSNSSCWPRAFTSLRTPLLHPLPPRGSFCSRVDHEFVALSSQNKKKSRPPQKRKNDCPPLKMGKKNSVAQGGSPPFLPRGSCNATASNVYLFPLLILRQAEVVHLFLFFLLTYPSLDTSCPTLDFYRQFYMQWVATAVWCNAYTPKQRERSSPKSVAWTYVDWVPRSLSLSHSLPILKYKTAFWKKKKKSSRPLAVLNNSRSNRKRNILLEFIQLNLSKTYKAKNVKQL